MIQHAYLAPELPFANEAYTPPNPKSSTPKCYIILLLPQQVLFQ